MMRLFAAHFRFARLLRTMNHSAGQCPVDQTQAHGQTQAHAPHQHLASVRRLDQINGTKKSRRRQDDIDATALSEAAPLKTGGRTRPDQDRHKGASEIMLGAKRDSEIVQQAVQHLVRSSEEHCDAPITAGFRIHLSRVPYVPQVQLLVLCPYSCEQRKLFPAIQRIHFPS